MMDSFEEHRPYLFGIAYRMLGSIEDAEDALQETYIRWQSQSPESINSPKAFLSTVVTRICIDHLRVARVQREKYVGPWLPEPLIAVPPTTPSSADRYESLHMAFLVLLESLNPVERAVFLLRDVFQLEFAEIANVVEKSESNCRQIISRARRTILQRPETSSATVDPTEAEELSATFLRACREGDLNELLNMLAENVTLYSDGGGKAKSALRPIVGQDNVARFMLGVTRKSPNGMRVLPSIVNGQPGFIAEIDGQPASVLSLDISAARIRTICIVNNPDKLGRVHTSPKGKNYQGASS